jgi:hypothetical protein
MVKVYQHIVTVVKKVLFDEILIIISEFRVETNLYTRCFCHDKKITL